jgi:hypothetical protein
MRSPAFVRSLVASCAGLAIVLASGSAVHAQARAEVGLITAVDLAATVLVLDTRTGSQHLCVALTATIRGDHGAVLSIRDLAAGDAVSYHTASATVTGLRVARQFWALPLEW